MRWWLLILLAAATDAFHSPFYRGSRGVWRHGRLTEVSVTATPTVDPTGTVGPGPELIDAALRYLNDGEVGGAAEACAATGEPIPYYLCWHWSEIGQCIFALVTEYVGDGSNLEKWRQFSDEVRDSSPGGHKSVLGGGGFRQTLAMANDWPGRMKFVSYVADLRQAEDEGLFGDARPVQGVQGLEILAKGGREADVIRDRLRSCIDTEYVKTLRHRGSLSHLVASYLSGRSESFLNFGISHSPFRRGGMGPLAMRLHLATTLVFATQQPFLQRCYDLNLEAFGPQVPAFLPSEARLKVWLLTRPTRPMYELFQKHMGPGAWDEIELAAGDFMNQVGAFQFLADGSPGAAEGTKTESRLEQQEPELFHIMASEYQVLLRTAGLLH